MKFFRFLYEKLALVLILLGLNSSEMTAETPLQFKVVVLAVDANEGCDVGDVDGDGLLDVVAGRNWYKNGAWTPRPVRLIEDVSGYVHSNCDFLIDVNQDGRLDVVSSSFFKSEVSWYENPSREGLVHGHLWQRRTLTEDGLNTNEFSMMRDLDGDGSQEWIANSWTNENPLSIYRFVSGDSKEQPWKLERHILNTELKGVGQGHGMGFGDVNNDGREDILVGTGWYERPEGDIWSMRWAFHADWNRQLSCPVIVRDVNKDGLADIIWGNPHDFGLFLWLGQGEDSSGKWVFEEQLIDEDYSQLHALHMADLDGDGSEELITGKRVRAHNGNDPGGNQPPRICYYELGPSAASFERFDIELGHVGIGLQIRTADLNADGKLDIVLAGKDGTQILFQE